MKKIKNPPLQKGDRVVLVYMPDESLETGTKGLVKGIEKTPSFGNYVDYQYVVEWYDEDGKVISTLGLLPGVDSWLFDLQYQKSSLIEAKIVDLDTLISKHEWSRLI